MAFAGKTVLVTGATSGIGAATAEAFAREGARVMLTGRSRARGEAAVKAISGRGGKARFVAANLRKRAACERVIAATLEHFGPLDVLVNNAGVIHRATVENTTDEQWRETMAANLDAVFFLSRLAIPIMRERGHGAIVNVASDAALIGAPAMAAYCASKGAVLQLTRAMAIDHAKQGIRVNAVCPDNVETPMLASEAEQLGVERERYFRQAAEAIPLGRNGSPEDVANAIVFLASDQASWITGIGLVLDGGYTAQ